MGTPQLAFLFIALAIAIAASGLFAVRRMVPLQELKTNHEVGGMILGVISQLYVILLAFVVVVVWGHYSDTATQSTRAAASLGGMFWLAQGLPDPARHQIQVHLRDYAQTVVSDEWPLLAHGQESDKAWAIHDQIWQDLYQLSGKPGIDAAIYSNLLEEMRSVDENRRLRLAGSEERVPRLMWIILIGGGVESVLFTYLFGTKRVGVQIAMTAALVLLIGLVLFLIAELNSPFSGNVRLQPTEFQSILQFMNQQLGP